MFTALHKAFPPARAASRLAGFARDARGTISAAFAMTGLVATLLVGASIDYSRSISVQQKLQAAVDAAMLAALQASAANRTNVATQVLNASLGNSGIVATWTSGPTVNGDGSLSGTAQGVLGLAHDRARVVHQQSTRRRHLDA